MQKKQIGFLGPVEIRWEYTEEEFEKYKNIMEKSNITKIEKKDGKIYVYRKYYINPRVLWATLKIWPNGLGRGRCPCKPEQDACLCPEFIHLGICKCKLFIPAK